MPIQYRFASLGPAPEGDICYLTEPLYMDASSDLRQLEIDFRSKVSGAEGAFWTSELFDEDAACKRAIAEKERELKAAGRKVERVSVYDTEIL